MRDPSLGHCVWVIATRASSSMKGGSTSRFIPPARFSEQQVPDQRLQLKMMEDCLDRVVEAKGPATAVLLNGDGVFRCWQSQRVK